jgi:hypothetical protein
MDMLYVSSCVNGPSSTNLWLGFINYVAVFSQFNCVFAVGIFIIIFSLYADK